MSSVWIRELRDEFEDNDDPVYQTIHWMLTDQPAFATPLAEEVLSLIRSISSGALLESPYARLSPPPNLTEVLEVTSYLVERGYPVNEWTEARICTEVGKLAASEDEDVQDWVWEILRTIATK